MTFLYVENLSLVGSKAFINAKYLNRMVTKTTVSEGEAEEKRIELVLFKFCKNCSEVFIRISQHG